MESLHVRGQGVADDPSDSGSEATGHPATTPDVTTLSGRQFSGNLPLLPEFPPLTGCDPSLIMHNDIDANRPESNVKQGGKP